MTKLEGSGRQKHPRLFVSYSHDSPEHSARVLALARALRSHGIDVELDQFHHHEILDWPRWCSEQTDCSHSDFVLCVCTRGYFQRIEGKVPPEKGKGVHWEGALLDDEVYDQKGNRRMLPVLFDNELETSIPRFLRGWTFCRLHDFTLVDSGFEQVLRILTQQARILKNELGTPPVLPTCPDPMVAAPPKGGVFVDLGAVYQSGSDSSYSDIRFSVSNKTEAEIKITAVQLLLRSAAAVRETESKVPAAPLPDRALRAKITPSTKIVQLLPSHHVLKPGEVDGFKLLVSAEEGYRYDVILRILWHTMHSGKSTQPDQEVDSDVISLMYRTRSTRALLALASRKRGRS
jgi:hypothetical protein